MDKHQQLRRDLIKIFSLTGFFIAVMIAVYFLDQNTPILQPIADALLK